MLTRIVKDGRAWVESTEGFKVQFFMLNGGDSWLCYTEGGREIIFDALYWYPGRADLDLSKLTVRQLTELEKNTVLRIYVPDVLRWREVDKIILSDDRSRILDNIRSALEFENEKPVFLREPKTGRG